MAYLRDLYAQWRRFPQSIKIFYFTDIFFGLAVAIYGTLFNLHLIMAGFTTNHIGSLQSAASLTTALIAIPIGMIGDRWGRRWLFVLGSLLFGAAYLVLPFLKEFTPLMIVYTIWALGNALILVNESPLLAGEVTSDLRSSVYSFMFVNFFLWQAIGPRIAGMLAERLPAGAMSTYEWPLAIAGACGIICGITRLFMPVRKASLPPHALRLQPSRTALVLSLVSIAEGAALALPVNFSNVVLLQRFAFSTETIASAFTVAGLAGWAGSFLAPWVSQHIGERKGYLSVVCVHGVTLLAMGLAVSRYLFLSGFWIRAVVNTMHMSLFLSFSMGIAHETERATVNSYTMVGRSLGIAIASKVYGSALAAENFLLAFTLSGVLAIGAAFVSMSLLQEKHTITDSQASGL